MQRKDPNVNREFVCEATDEANLMRLASHGHAVDLLFYLTALANDKIELFFNDVTKAETFIKCFPNRQSREAFLNGVLQSKTKLMPLVPPQPLYVR